MTQFLELFSRLVSIDQRNVFINAIDAQRIPYQDKIPTALPIIFGEIILNS